MKKFQPSYSYYKKTRYFFPKKIQLFFRFLKSRKTVGGKISILDWMGKQKRIYLIPLCKSLVIRQKGESQNRCFKKTEHAKFSEKLTFFTSWYAHVRFSRFPNIKGDFSSLLPIFTGTEFRKILKTFFFFQQFTYANYVKDNFSLDYNFANSSQFHVAFFSQIFLPLKQSVKIVTNL